MRSDSFARPREGGDPARHSHLRGNERTLPLPLSQRVQPGERDLLVLMPLHAPETPMAPTHSSGA